MKKVIAVSLIASVLFLAGCKTSTPISVHSHSSSTEWEQPLWIGYDAQFADAIQARWFQLLEQRPMPEDKGRVILDFLLLPDGTIDELSIKDNTEGEVLAAMCAKAILDPVPFRPWNSEMQNVFGPARRFRVTFEFDAWGTPYLDYTEDLMELARAGRPPETTFLVLTCSRKPARNLNKVTRQI